ncbi:MAG TPA: hypothetical protein VG779_11660 [Actinomycetota bacterium]|nr:hypothetical protein [Actinomycetota bacterium]
MTITLEKCGMTGFGEVVLGEGTGVGVLPGPGVDVCRGTGVPAALGVVGAGPAGVGRAAAAGGDVRAIDDVGLLDPGPGMAGRAEPDGNGPGAGVARVRGDGVTTARVSVGKGAPHAVSTRVHANVRRARTRLGKPTASYRLAGLGHAVQRAFPF